MTLDLEVLVPDGIVLKTRILGLQATDASGRFGVWPGHEALVTVLEPCILAYRDETEHERFVAVDGGVLVLENGVISIACREAIPSDQLTDVANRADAILRQRRLTERTARGEFAELKSTLMRQLKKADVPR